jgi:hypothetical protein
MEISLGGLTAIFLTGLLLGWLICWLLGSARHLAAMSRLQESAAGQLTASQQDLALIKATSAEQLLALRRDIERIQDEKSTFAHVVELQQGLATATASTKATNDSLTAKVDELRIVRANSRMCNSSSSGQNKG